MIFRKKKRKKYACISFHKAIPYVVSYYKGDQIEIKHVIEIDDTMFKNIKPGIYYQMNDHSLRLCANKKFLE